MAGAGLLFVLKLVYMALDGWGNAEFVLEHKPWEFLASAWVPYVAMLIMAAGIVWFRIEGSRAASGNHHQSRQSDAGEPCRTPTTAGPTRWHVLDNNVRWETDGTFEKGRLSVGGPFCPYPCLARLSYYDGFDNGNDNPRSVTLGGDHGGGLSCRVCGTDYGDLDANKTIDGELPLFEYRSMARVKLEALIRQEQHGITQRSSS